MTVEEDHEIDTESVDFVFFDEHVQTAKLVLILREHKCRWTETFLVQGEGNRDLRIVKSVRDMGRRTGLRRLIFKSDQESSILGLKVKWILNLVVSHEVIMEVRPVSAQQSYSKDLENDPVSIP